MYRWGLGDLVRVSLLVVAVVTLGATTVLATSSSQNYQVTDMQFGASSSKETCSGQYCAQATIGDMIAGSSKGPTESSAKFSSLTDEEPRLEVIVDPGQSNLGVLSPERTATKTMVVRIVSYMSEGYVMQIAGDPPKYSGHTLATPTAPTASTQGTEQFAINVVKNTSPDVGENPEYVPSDQMSFGEVEDGYNTANLFKYISGDVIARSRAESGRTDFTVSMIVNVSNATPAGHYAGDFSAVIIPFY